MCRNYSSNPKHLTSSDAEVGTEQFCMKLGTVLTENQHLRKLNMEYNNVGSSGVRHITSALCQNSCLVELNLYSNSIGDSGANSVSNMLTKSHSLKRLYLQYNNIGIKGCTSISESLSVNHSLEVLNLSNNCICETGMWPLLLLQYFILTGLQGQQE